MFTGSGKSKYSNELLELTCNFEFEYPKELQTVVLNNWLCNLSGHDGCWFPMDLLQEKNIKQLKKMLQRQDTTFGSDFFQEIIAINIQAFLESKKTMRRVFQLSDLSENHIHIKKEASLKELLWNMGESALHKFCTGHTQGHVVQDDLMEGLHRLTDTSQINDFIECTLRDAGAIHDETIQDGISEPFRSAPDMLNMLINGSLVLGDEFSSDSTQIGDIMGLLGMPTTERN